MWIQIRRLLQFVKVVSKAFQERTKHIKVVVTGTLRVDILYQGIHVYIFFTILMSQPKDVLTENRIISLSWFF